MTGGGSGGGDGDWLVVVVVVVVVCGVCVWWGDDGDAHISNNADINLASMIFYMWPNHQRRTLQG